MISHLSGTVLDKRERFAIIEAGGIGYRVFATGETLTPLREGASAKLWTHHAVREDGEDLYGFPSREELSFFELLISVSSIGPKTALNILNITTIENLRRAITTGETAHLVKVSGIGRKTAERIVVELREKLVSDEKEGGAALKEEIDALEALKSLGYSHTDAREALKKVSAAADTSDRVRQALKILGK